MRVVGSFALMISGFAVLAAPETQTFPVTVSNAVSGKLETVPVTFRISETNGVIERIDGTRFVPVPVKPHESVPLAERLNRKVEIAPEHVLATRLRELELQEQVFSAMTLSNAAKRLEQEIRRADSTTSTPVKVKVACYLREADFTMPAFTVPQTNAYGALRSLAQVATKAQDMAHAGEAGWTGLPFTFHIRGGDTVSFNYEDDGAVTRSYRVPGSFSNRFPKAGFFAAYVRQRLNVAEWGETSYNSDFDKIRVTCYSTKLMGRFDAEVYEPLLELLMKPSRLASVSCRTGDRARLYFKGENDGAFVGLYLYQACGGQDCLLKDVLLASPVDTGMSAEKVFGPKTFSCPDETGSVSGLGESKAVAGCFLLYSHNGSVVRLEDERVFSIEVEEVPDPLFRQEEPSPHEQALDLLEGVVLPEIIMGGNHITNGIAQIQSAIDATSAPTNRIRITIDLPRIQALSFKAQKPDISDDPFGRGPPESSMTAITNVSAFSAQFVTAHDALKLLAELTNLHIVSGGKESVELVTYSTYTQRLWRVKTYLLPKRLCQHIPDSDWWAEYMRLAYMQGYHVESYSAETCELSICSESGTFDVADANVKGSYCLFSGRFTLENTERQGRPELVLADTYRNIARRYRSGIGQDGKRWERFEVVR